MRSPRVGSRGFGGSAFGGSGLAGSSFFEGGGSSFAGAVGCSAGCADTNAGETTMASTNATRRARFIYFPAGLADAFTRKRRSYLPLLSLGKSAPIAESSMIFTSTLSA
jgi:hypothetical protein